MAGLLFINNYRGLIMNKTFLSVATVALLATGCAANVNPNAATKADINALRADIAAARSEANKAYQVAQQANMAAQDANARAVRMEGKLNNVFRTSQMK